MTRVSLDTSRALSDSRAITPAASLVGQLGRSPKEFGIDPDAVPISGRIEKNAVRLLVVSVIVVAILFCARMQMPNDLPAPALNQAGLYRLEVALLVFYGGLLILTPAFAGLFRGRLPTEISSRGAKFSEDIGQVAQATEKRIKKLENRNNDLAEELALVSEDIQVPKTSKTSGESG